MPVVTFVYFAGLRGDPLASATAELGGSWDDSGRRTSNWSFRAMTRFEAEDGCVAFRAEADIPASETGTWFEWGVSLTFADGRHASGITTEVHHPVERARHRVFEFSGAPQREVYYLTHLRRLGANKCVRSDGSTGVRFAVWAPNARDVQVVMGTVWDINDARQQPAQGALPFADIGGGYIADDGSGALAGVAPIALSRGADGVWQSDRDDPALARFEAYDHRPYMYRVVKANGNVAMRTDLFSRCQIGYGATKPQGAYDGRLADLDGSVSCSVVVDPERVTQYFKEEPPYLPSPPPAQRVWPEMHFIDTNTFWQDELGATPLPTRVEDLVIYELHLGALRFGSGEPGSLATAMRILDYLVELGVNAVELLPLCEFGGGSANWGYATSHYLAIEYGGGGRDQFKHFIKAAHQRGIAVIADVVFNHYVQEAERAQWAYDSDAADENIYYWYEGTPDAYADPKHGYVNNQSTGWAPRYYEEMVRKLFISSAVALLTEFHVDGFRVDQTTSIHNYNRLNQPDNEREVSSANMYGAKLLRELNQTLRLIEPGVMLMAEDHSDWAEVTRPLQHGGMGFDARWYADFYHHLAGDTRSDGRAKLLYLAGKGDERELEMDWFAGALGASQYQKVVYSESHDEAGNSSGPIFDPFWDGREQDKRCTSHRSIRVAVDDAPLFGDTRWYAEARCRFAYGVTALSAGTPLFLFGEEVGAANRFKYNDVESSREDLEALRQGSGAGLFRFYSEMTTLRRQRPALRSRNIDVLHTHNANRVIAFRRWCDSEELLVVASLGNRAYDQGYFIGSDRIAAGGWREIFNSDSERYGGRNDGNAGRTIDAAGGGLTVVLPICGVLVFARE